MSNLINQVGVLEVVDGSFQLKEIIKYEDAPSGLQRILDQVNEDAKNGFKDYVRRDRPQRRLAN